MSWAELKPEHRALALEHLTPKQLRVFQHRLDGHSWKTIADALDMSRSGARQHYETAIKKMRRHLREAA